MQRLTTTLTIMLLSVLTLSANASNPHVILETSAGNIDIELYEKEAPETVANFISYVNEGFYDGTIFHRVVKGFVIQGGGFTKELSKKKTKKPIKNEAKESLKNLRGTLSMARLSAPNSATSQFFINLEDNKSLDYRPWNVGYAVFGKVTDVTMGIVSDISYQPVGTVGMLRDVPNNAIIINKARLIRADSAPAPAGTPSTDATSETTTTETQTESKAPEGSAKE